MCPAEATRDGLECVTMDILTDGAHHVSVRTMSLGSHLHDPIGVYHFLLLELSRADLIRRALGHTQLTILLYKEFLHGSERHIWCSLDSHPERLCAPKTIIRINDISATLLQLSSCCVVACALCTRPRWA